MDSLVKLKILVAKVILILLKINYNIGIYTTKSHTLSTSFSCDKYFAKIKTICEMLRFHKAPASLYKLLFIQMLVNVWECKYMQFWQDNIL